MNLQIKMAYFSIFRSEPYVELIRTDSLSSQKLLAAIFLQKKSIMQVLAANILMRISIVKIISSLRQAENDKVEQI